MMTKPAYFYVLLLAMPVMVLMTACGTPVKHRFFVEGNCPECGSLIEKVLSNHTGVDSAGWNIENSLVVVKYFPKKTDPDQLQQALAKAGFNTQFYPGEATAREGLPVCCQQRIDRSLERYEPQLPAGH